MKIWMQFAWVERRFVEVFTKKDLCVYRLPVFNNVSFVAPLLFFNTKNLQTYFGWATTSEECENVFFVAELFLLLC